MRADCCIVFSASLQEKVLRFFRLSLSREYRQEVRGQGGAGSGFRPTLNTGPRPRSVEQGGAQSFVRWQNGGADHLQTRE